MASLLIISDNNSTMVLARVVFFLPKLFSCSLSGFDYYFSGRLHARGNWPIRITGCPLVVVHCGLAAKTIVD